MKLIKNILIIFISIQSITLIGSAKEPIKDDSFENSKSLMDRVRFLHSFHPNYISYVVPSERDDKGDVAHLEFYLSFKAPAIDFNSENSWARKKHLFFLPERFKPDRLHLAYNGLYDFYINALTPEDTDIYDSSPVISKIQNPGLFFEWDLPKYKTHSGNNILQIGLFHESNGQTLSDPSEFNSLVVNKSEEFALSQTSRSWDYISVAYEYKNYNIHEDTSKSLKWFSLRTELRGYLGDREEDIFWKPVAEQPQISDYDGLRLTAETKFDFPWFKDKEQLVRAELKTGISSLDALTNISAKVSYNIRISDGSWLSFSYFNGYGKDLSNYHERRKYFGVGFEFR